MVSLSSVADSNRSSIYVCEAAPNYAHVSLTWGAARVLAKSGRGRDEAKLGACGHFGGLLAKFVGTSDQIEVLLPRWKVVVQLAGLWSSWGAYSQGGSL